MKSLKVDQDLLIEGITLINPALQILYANATSEKQFGMKSNELIGKTLTELFPEEELGDLILYLRQAIEQSEPRKSNDFHIVHDLTNIWYKIKILPVPEGALVLSIDISNLKTAEINYQEQIHDLENVIKITSQKVKDPILNMMSITRILNKQVFTEEELTKVSDYLNESVHNLNETITELNNVVDTIRKNHKLP